MNTIDALSELKINPRISGLKEKMLEEKRFFSLEQARLVTEVYAANPEKPVILKRALALKHALENMEIRIEPDELIVGNRTKGVRAGVAFPESGISWIDKELETLETRPQDKFLVRPEDIREFREDIFPFWKGHALEDQIRKEIGAETDAIAKVAKINQKDHAQGHICPNTEKWLAKGPAGLRAEALTQMSAARGAARDFYESVALVLEGASGFMLRYSDLAGDMASKEADP